jgi:hypothetical protein
MISQRRDQIGALGRGEAEGGRMAVRERKADQDSWRVSEGNDEALRMREVRESIDADREATIGKGLV